MQSSKPETNQQIRNRFARVFKKLEQGQQPGKAPGSNAPTVIPNLLSNSSMHPTVPIDPRAIPEAPRFPPYPSWNNVVRTFNRGTAKKRRSSKSRKARKSRKAF